MQVLIASIMHEGNTFAPTSTTLAQFEQGGLYEGSTIVDVFRGTNTELGGFIEVAESNGVELVPLIAAAAVPSGPLTRETFVVLRERLLAGIRANSGFAGVLLALHGALVADGSADGDGEILAAVRLEVGRSIPIVATLDLHANLTERMVTSADALIGYDKLPHTDAGEKGARAGALLLNLIDGSTHPTMAWQKVPMLATPENTHTLFGPLAELVARAKAIEREPGVLSTSIFPVHPWLDVPELGWATLVVTDGQPALAAAKARELAGLAWSRREELAVELVPVPVAIERARALPSGPAIFANSADNTGGGAPGDNTAVLAGLLAANLSETALLTIVDPAAVDAAISAGVGRQVTLEVGGHLDNRYSQPVRITAYVRTIADGRYRYRSNSYTGLEVKMGRTAVLQIGGIHLVICELKCMTIDPALYRSVGLEPAEARIVVVKTASGFRGGYAGIAKAIYILDTPGYCPPNLRLLTYTRAPRPIFPLDPDFEDWAPTDRA